MWLLFQAFLTAIPIFRLNSVSRYFIYFGVLSWLAYFEIFSKDLKASLCQGFTGKPARGCFKVSSPVQWGRRIYFAQQDMYQGLSKDLDACFENLDTKIDPFSSLLIFAVIPVQNFFSPGRMWLLECSWHGSEATWRWLPDLSSGGSAAGHSRNPPHRCVLECGLWDSEVTRSKKDWKNFCDSRHKHSHSWAIVLPCAV